MNTISGTKKLNRRSKIMLFFFILGMVVALGEQILSVTNDLNLIPTLFSTILLFAWSVYRYFES